MKTLFVAAISLFAAAIAVADAPFGGTVYTEPDIYTEDDPSTFQSSRFREMVLSGSDWADEFSYDCDGNYIEADYYLFDAGFSGGHRVKIYVQDRHGDQDKAQWWTNEVTYVLGQMPRILRRGVKQIVLLTRGGDWCAGFGEMMIETQTYEQERRDGALEESMVHEVVHTSLDERYEEDRGYLAAARKDGTFISDYAKNDGEDLAETFTLYLGYIRDRLDEDDAELLLEFAPNRIEWMLRTFPAGRLSL